MNKRIERIVPEPPSLYEAYLYLWSIWIEEKDDWKYYGGWKGDQYHLTDYTDSSEDKSFRKDFATRKTIKFEILQYGTKNDMAYAERKMLAEADNGIGAKKSEKWYNKSNGGGRYANGYITNNPLDKLWTDLNTETFSTCVYKKPKLAYYVENGYLIQSRQELFDTDHLKIITDCFNVEPHPDEWDEIHVLKDAKPVINEKGLMVGVEYEEGSIVIIGGNHRARGCVNSDNGYALNTVEIPHSHWKDLTYHQLRTLSDRLNPFDPKPSKSIDVDSKAEWVIDECKEKNLYRKNEKLENVFDYRHKCIVDELDLINCPRTIKNQIFTKVQRLLENEKLQLNNDNLIDLSEEGLKADKNLKEWYDNKVAALSEEYDWVYKISAHNYSILKVMEEMKRNGWGKKGCILPFFKTKEFKDGGDWKKAKDTFDSYIEHVFDSSYEISTIPLPITKAQAKAEGYEDKK